MEDTLRAHSKCFFLVDGISAPFAIWGQPRYLHSPGSQYATIIPTNITRICKGGDCYFCDSYTLRDVSRLRPLIKRACAHSRTHAWLPDVVVFSISQIRIASLGL